MPEEKIYQLKDLEPNEIILWERFLQGDLKAWEKIFTLYYEDLFGYGLKLSNQEELTKDCIYELFVNIWERRNHLSEVDSVKAYLLASLRRSLLKKLKKRRKYYEDRKDPLDHTIKIQFSPEVQLIKDEVRAGKLEALFNALDELPDRQKEVLFLKYFNGMSYDEIEEILSINYQSIKNHIYRAISNLRENMGEDFSKIAISLSPYLLFFSSIM